MAATPNSLLQSQPTTVTINAVILGDIVSCLPSGSAETFSNKASGRQYALNGGTTGKAMTYSISTTDKSANALRAGTKVTTLDIVYAGKGDASGSLTIAMVGSGQIISNKTSENNGRMQWDIEIELFSSNGTLRPISTTYA